MGVFRHPSGNSSGNTFDHRGRQLSCGHGNRRVVRYEHDGTVTVLADSYEGTQLNSPNDAVVHPDGGIWFTDPPYGASLATKRSKRAGLSSGSRKFLVRAIDPAGNERESQSYIWETIGGKISSSCRGTAIGTPWGTRSR